MTSRSRIVGVLLVALAAATTMSACDTSPPETTTSARDVHETRMHFEGLGLDATLSKTIHASTVRFDSGQTEPFASVLRRDQAAYRARWGALDRAFARSLAKRSAQEEVKAVFVLDGSVRDDKLRASLASGDGAERRDALKALRAAWQAPRSNALALLSELGLKAEDMGSIMPALIVTGPVDRIVAAAKRGISRSSGAEKAPVKSTTAVPRTASATRSST